MHVFDFDHAHALGAGELRVLLGSKGAGLAEMSRELGLRVPPGFTIGTPGHAVFQGDGGLDALRPELDAALARLERRLDRRLGDPERPLLLSVRSGAPVSMPGMLDTVLNLGLNDATCAGLARATSPGFAWDCYARFLRMFAEIVMGVPAEAFAASEGAPPRERALAWRAAAEKEAGEAIPQGPREQLERAVAAVFQSWEGARAVAYRRREGIPAEPGTAVNVQAMVFGNREGVSGSGVGFTRDPSTGERVVYGDYLAGAQGEDVVSGSRATRPLATLGEEAPEVYAELLTSFERLERHYRDACDVEFTVEQGVLWILQARAAKRTGAAAVRIAVEMASDPEFPLGREEALARVQPEQLRQALAAGRVAAGGVPIAKGLGASPGVATGGARFSVEAALAAADRGEPLILVRQTTSPEDVPGMAVAEGILTATGGLASHAAVVARSWGKPAVVGVSELVFESQRGVLADRTIEEGEELTIDGASGEVFAGRGSRSHASRSPWVETLLGWATELLGADARELDPVAQLERAQRILRAGSLPSDR